MTAKLSGAVIALALVGLTWMQVRQEQAPADTAATAGRPNAIDGVGVQAERPTSPAVLIESHGRRAAIENPVADEATTGAADAAAQAAPIRPGELESISGVLVVPREWYWSTEDEGTLSFVSSRNSEPIGKVDSFETLSGFDLRLAWRLENVPAGTARVTFAPLGARWSVAVPVGGRDDIELVVPAPADVLVRVEGESGRILGQADLDQGTLLWSFPLKGNDSRELIGAGPPRADGLYELRVPTGEVEIHFSHADYPNTGALVEATAGQTQNVTLLATRGCGVIVKFIYRDGTPAPAPDIVLTSQPTFELLSKGGPARATFWSSDPYLQSFGTRGDGLLLTLVGPGHYRYNHRRAEGGSGTPLPKENTGEPVEESYDVVVHPGEYTELVITVDE